MPSREGERPHNLDLRSLKPLPKQREVGSSLKKPESRGFPGAKSPDVSAPAARESDPTASLRAEQRAREQLSKPPPEEPLSLFDASVQDTGGGKSTPHNQDLEHFHAIRNDGNFRDATTLNPDAWQYDDKIFRAGAGGGLMALNKRILRMEREEIKNDPGWRRALMDFYKIGGAEPVRRPDDYDKEKDDRRDGQYEGYLRGLKDALGIIARHNCKTHCKERGVGGIRLGTGRRTQQRESERQEVASASVAASCSNHTAHPSNTILTNA
jgi:hypothetical protein